MRPGTDSSIYAAHDGDWRAPGNKLSSLARLNPPRFRYFDRFIRRWKGLDVLDVGCGGGFTAEFLAERGARVSGIDPEEAALDAARAHAATMHLSIDYRAGTAERLPYPDAAFDAAICVDVLEHVEDVAAGLKEIARVLRPGGYLLFDTINQTFMAKVVMIGLLEDILRIIPRGAHDWNRFIPPARLERQLEEAGFTSIHLSGFPVQAVQYIGTARKATKGVV